ncbi:MAG: GCN5-related N-acetyltransferase [Myxococcaceae bacterium]|nr:GCN5-related N-acetyltransferase [Myxococcaceae bacterium]
MAGQTHAQYTVRLASAGDLAQLPAIEMAAAQRFHGSLHPAAAGGFPISVALLQRWLAHDGVWVAETLSTVEPARGAQLAGFAAWVPMALDMYVVELDVHPDHAGNKVGAQLLDELSSLGDKLGFERLVLRTFSDVPWNAPYYHRLGFEALGEREEYPELRSIRQQETSVGLDSDMRSTLFRSIRA